jgi:hypothetical protein
MPTKIKRGNKIPNNNCLRIDILDPVPSIMR